MTRLVVLDFDGTMTDAEAEGAPFRGGYLGDLAALTGLDIAEVEALAERFEAEIAMAPEAHGWIFNGQIVAPASVDPYLRVMPVARRILDHTGSFLDPTDRTRLLDAILYKYNYQKTLDAPREGALETLLALKDVPVYVVTNSHTDAVSRKVVSIGTPDGGPNQLDWLLPRIHGRAKKYVLDATFDAVDESMTLPGLSRPVLLRRRHYHDVVDTLRTTVGCAWSEVLVVGDIFELDLALPLACGARVALMCNPFTPPWESAFLESHPRGSLISSVGEIPGLCH